METVLKALQLCLWRCAIPMALNLTIEIGVSGVRMHMSVCFLVNTKKYITNERYDNTNTNTHSNSISSKVVTTTVVVPTYAHVTDVHTPKIAHNPKGHVHGCVVIMGLC